MRWTATSSSGARALQTLRGCHGAPLLPTARRYYEKDDGTSLKGEVMLYRFEVEAPVTIDGYDCCIALTHERKRCFYCAPDRASEIQDWTRYCQVPDRANHKGGTIEYAACPLLWYADLALVA